MTPSTFGIDSAMSHLPSPTILMLWTIGAFIAVVSYKVLVGAIESVGLLSDRPDSNATPERVQLLIGTILGISAYVTHCLSTLSTGQPHLVDPEEWMVAVFGGNHVIYLITKTLRSP